MPTTFANKIDNLDIYAKRAEQDKDGNQIDTTYAKLNDIPTDVVPAVTSTDDGKVLKASYSGGQGSYSWQTESGGGGSVNDVEVNGSSVVNAQGVAEITVPAQEQSNWAESDTTDPAYIQNKPTEKNLVAGDGISIATSSSSVTISTDETVLFNSSGSGTGINSSTPITLSESIRNFESVRIVNRKGSEARLRINGLSPDIYTVTFPYSPDNQSNNMELITCTFTVDSSDPTKLWYKSNRNMVVPPSGSISISMNATNQTSKIQFIIGIKRISS